MWTKLREAAAAQAAFRSSSTRLKGEPQKTTIFSLFSKWRPKCGKKVHLFNVKSSPSLLAARWSSTFWNSRARWILRWNGKAGFGAISRRSRVKICLQKSGVDELTGFALKACRLCARVSPEPGHEDAHVQGEWRAKRWRWEKVDRSRSKIERPKGINKKQLKRCFLQYVSREVEQKCKCFLRCILNCLIQTFSNAVTGKAPAAHHKDSSWPSSSFCKGQKSGSPNCLGSHWPKWKMNFSCNASNCGPRYFGRLWWWGEMGLQCCFLGSFYGSKQPARFAGSLR